jgi:thiol-disulfide isomerase/thioredoxin
MTTDNLQTRRADRPRPLPLAAILASAFALAGLCAGAARSQSGPAAGGAAPPPAAKAAATAPQKTLEVVDADRYLALVAEHHGKPLMVTFWATWCEPCRDEYPMVIELVRQYQPKGLAVFAMDLDDNSEETLALHFIAKTQPVFLNYRKKPGKEEEFINRVNPKWTGALPATFFYTPDGRLAAQLVGEHPREAFVSAIEQLLTTSAKN